MLHGIYGAGKYIVVSAGTFVHVRLSSLLEGPPLAKICKYAHCKTLKSCFLVAMLPGTNMVPHGDGLRLRVM